MRAAHASTADKIDGSAGWIATDQSGTVAAPLDPNLGPLSWRLSGGPTGTRRPLPGSAAIDRGGTGGPVTDQTGHARPWDDPGVTNATGGDGSDVGAVETQPPVCFAVSGLGDPGPGSLRRAIEHTALGDSVCFASGLPGTIVLSYGPIDTGKDLILAGPGADVITLSANGGPRVLGVLPFASWTISGLTLTGAAHVDSGCVNVDVNASATIEGCAIVDMAGFGSLVLRNSTVAGNTTAATVAGVLSAKDLTLENCTISDNSGSWAGSVWLAGNYSRSIVHCTIAGNQQSNGAAGAGGVYNQAATAPSVGGNVIAGNASPFANRNDIGGSFSSQGCNLIGINNGGGFPGTGDQVGSVGTPLDPAGAVFAETLRMMSTPGFFGASPSRSAGT